MKKLGFGLMRLPVLDKLDADSIDVKQVKRYKSYCQNVLNQLRAKLDEKYQMPYSKNLDKKIARINKGQGAGGDLPLCPRHHFKAAPNFLNSSSFFMEPFSLPWAVKTPIFFSGWVEPDRMHLFHNSLLFQIFRKEFRHLVKRNNICPVV